MTKPPMSTSEESHRQALIAIQHALDKMYGCSEEERSQLKNDLVQLQEMSRKLTTGRLEIVVFGEISTGKSALINALVGQQVSAVDVQGGWTKEVWQVPWQGCGYVMEGLGDSQVVLVDTPGLNEVGGDDREAMAEQAASRADLILFVIDSDLNEIEYQALLRLLSAHKPILLVLNKIDLYSPDQRRRLLEVLQVERLAGMLPESHVLTASADPREVEYIIENADGTSRHEWRQPPPDVSQVKTRILDVLEEEGLELLALNAAMYAADKTDRVVELRMRLRLKRAQQTIASFAAIKAMAVALNPVPVADVVGGTAVDVSMVMALAHIYGLELTWHRARGLVQSILQAAGWVVGGALLGETITHVASNLFKAMTFGYGTVLTALPQGAAAGYSSYIVGQAAQHYFEHGASWGHEAPKAVVQRLLQETDKGSVIENLRGEIKRKLQHNRYADTPPT